ncbi:hypothetical protein BD626DRAFT_478073 [Schizophyllum amplum]|uniref:F-box domain-containing protein n=1 Tax=Schizophyllum amplum TaxID=97359 RepID=A0A550D0Q9_9AGAR|nr:hypothetical protein BD626DRAFT_478073 [Auriculariopsis ampla]
MALTGIGDARRHKYTPLASPSQQIMSILSNSVFSISALAYMSAVLNHQAAFREPYIVLVGNWLELFVVASTVLLLLFCPILGLLSKRYTGLGFSRVHALAQFLAYLAFGISTYLFTYKARIMLRPGAVNVTLIINLNDWGFVAGSAARCVVTLFKAMETLIGMTSGIVTFVAIGALFVVTRRASKRISELAKVEATFWDARASRMGHLAHNPSGHPWLSDMPPEILEEICKRLGLYNLLFVCLVDKHLNASATRWLYRHVLLRKMSQSVKFFRTIVHSDAAAAAVRTLFIDPSRITSDASCWLPAYHKLMAAAMRRMRGVEILPLQHSRYLPLLLANAHFPALQQCDIHLTSATPVFLSRQPTLRSVYIRTRLPIDVDYAFYHDEFRHIASSFSNVEILTCPSYIAGAILPQPSVRSITIMWNSETIAWDAAEVYGRLCMLEPTLYVLRSITTMRELPAHLRAMKSYPLTTTKIDFRVTDIPPRPDADVYLQFADVLSKIPTLKVFYLTGTRVLPVFLDLNALDEEQDVVHTFCSRCPSLVQVILGSGTNWVVASRGTVLPSLPRRSDATMPDSRLTARWIERSVHSGRIGWDCVPQVMELPYVDRLALIVPMISWAFRERQ